MKYSENRKKKKIAARVAHDRDSLGRRRINLWALLCVASLPCVFSKKFFSFCDIVRRGESGCFSPYIFFACVLCSTV